MTEEEVEPHIAGLVTFMLSGMAVLFAIVVTLYLRGMDLLQKVSQHKFVQTVHQVLYNGYFVELMITWISKNIVVNAVAKAARWVDSNIVDWLVNATVPASHGVYRAFKVGHSGKIGTYMGQFVIGVAIIVIAFLIIVKGL